MNACATGARQRARLASLLIGGAIVTAPLVASAQSRAACADTYEQAQVERQGKKPAAAHASFSKCAQSACPAIIREPCRQGADELAATLAEVVVRAKGEAAHGGIVETPSVDDATRGDATVGTAFLVEPGSHVFSVRARDGTIARATKVLRAGEKGVEIILDLDSANARATAGVPIGTGAPQAKEGAPTEPIAPPPEPGPRRHPAVLPLAATAAVGFIWFGAFGYSTRAEHDRLRDECARGACPAGARDGIDRRYLLADIGLGVGIVAAAASAYFYLRSPSSPARATVLASPRGRGIGAAWSF